VLLDLPMTFVSDDGSLRHDFLFVISPGDNQPHELRPTSNCYGNGVLSSHPSALSALLYILTCVCFPGFGDWSSERVPAVHALLYSKATVAAL
jgi:hypothetical protein